MANNRQGKVYKVAPDHRPPNFRVISCSWKSVMVQNETLAKITATVSLNAIYWNAGDTDEVGKLISTLAHKKDHPEHLPKLTELVRKDLAILSYARYELGLKEEIEAFFRASPL